MTIIIINNNNSKQNEPQNQKTQTKTDLAVFCGAGIREWS